MWDKVVNITADLIESEVPNKMESGILGIRPSPKEAKFKNRFIDLAMTLYKRQIAMNWKSKEPPNIRTWLRVLQKWAQAEANVLAEAPGRNANSENKLTWDTFVSNIATKDDTRPP